jgi:hypothetical protein
MTDPTLHGVTMAAKRNVVHSHGTKINPPPALIKLSPRHSWLINENGVESGPYPVKSMWYSGSSQSLRLLKRKHLDEIRFLAAFYGFKGGS